MAVGSVPSNVARVAPVRAEIRDRALTSLRSGAGVALVGPPGIGKTVLAGEIAAALSVTHEVLRAQGRHSGTDVPLGAFEALVPPGIDQVRAAIAAIRDRVDGARRPALLVIDDPSLFDDASAFMAHALSTSPGFVTLMCHRDGVALPAAIEQMWREGVVSPLALAPLDTPSLAAVAQTLLGAPLGPSTVARLALMADGSPLYLAEAVAGGLRSGDLRLDRGAWHWTGPWTTAHGRPAAGWSGPRLAAMVDDHLRSLSDAQREVLELVALAEPVPADLLVAGAGVAPTDVETLEMAGLLTVDDRGDVALVRQVHGEVLRRQMPATRRRRLAALLAGAAGDQRGFRQVRWRLEAGLSVSADELIAVGDAAARLEDPRTAEEFARRAIDAGAPVRGGFLLGLTLDETGRTNEAMDALGRAWALTVDRAASPEEFDAWVAVGLARAEVWFAQTDDVEGAAAMLREVEQRVPAAQRAVDISRVMHACLMGRPEEAMALAEPMLVDDSPVGDVARVALPVVLALAVTGQAGRAIELSQRLLGARQAVGEPIGVARTATFSVALAYAYGAAGRQDDALALAMHSHALALRHGALIGQAWLGLIIGDALQARGAAADAEAWFVDAAAAFGALHRPQLRWALAGAALAAAAQGAVDRASAHLAALEQFGRTCWVFLDPFIDRSRAWTAFAAGDPQSAFELLDAGIAVARKGGLHWVETLLLIDVVCFGAMGDAPQRLAELAPLVSDPRVGVWATASRALLEGDVSAVRAAAAHLHGMSLLMDAGDLLAIAAVRAWPNDLTVATDLAASAQRMYTDPRLRTPARLLLEGAPALSARVLDVAWLAAEGRSSKEIGDELHIGVRTVDNHLAKAYRTFGVASRRALATVLTAWFGDVRPAAAEPTA